MTRSQAHSRSSLHVVQGKLLLNIDNKIDNVLGLAVFYQYVRIGALSQRQRTQHVGVFTTELFAHYLCIRCLSVKPYLQHTTTIEIQQCQKCFSESNEMFISDALAFKLGHGTKCAGHFRKLFGKDETTPVTSGHLDTSQLVDLLKQSAVEHLTTFRQLQVQKFGSLFTIVKTDYEAMYAYKCGEYQRCLQLSTDNVRVLSSCPESLECAYAFPEFMQLMDDDIASLTGLMLIVNPACRQHSEHPVLSQMSLSIYLMTQCQIKLRHSLTSMARTLDYIEVTRHEPGCQPFTLGQLLLKLTEQKILLYVSVNSD